MTMHMDSARSEPTHYNTVQFGDQITVTEITTFGYSLRGNLTFTGGLSVERSGRVADDSLNARDTLGRNIWMRIALWSRSRVRRSECASRGGVRCRGAGGVGSHAIFVSGEFFYYTNSNKVSITLVPTP